MPVGLKTWVEHDRLYGRITNRHSWNWLRLALATCRPVHANGQSSGRELKVLIGARPASLPRQPRVLTTLARKVIACTSVTLAVGRWLDIYAVFGRVIWTW